jgi:hypothetical protein
MATYNARPPISLDLPRPGRAAIPFILLALAALGFEADRRLPWIVGVLGAAFFGGAAALRSYRAHRELETVRRTIDRLIVLEPHSSETSVLARWRSLELTSPGYRKMLARETNRVLSALDPRSLPGASPLRRPAARRSESLLRVLAARLADDRPVTARGVLLARQLLRDAGSPLFSEESEHQLPRALKHVLGALET